MDTPAGPGVGRWAYAEVTYHTTDRTHVLVDGVRIDDGRDVSQVVAALGAEGWEMVSAAPGTGAVHVLWLRRPVMPNPDADARPGVTHQAHVAPARSVVLTVIGNARFDKELHGRLVAAVGELAGVSGWRATRIVDKAPRVVATGLSEDEAERIIAALGALGATAEIR